MITDATDVLILLGMSPAATRSAVERRPTPSPEAAAVLAAMEAKAAQRLTLALARREAEKAPAMADTLPKIGSDG